MIGTICMQELLHCFAHSYNEDHRPSYWV